MGSTIERVGEFSEYAGVRRVALVRVAALLLPGGEARAEDAVQVALTRLYVVWPRVRPGTRDAYVRRCVVNAAIGERRGGFRRREQAHAEVPDVAFVADDFVDDAGLVRLSAALPACMRAAVVPRYVEALDAAGTAKALGCREGTVRSRGARGPERLRATFPQNEETFI